MYCINYEKESEHNVFLGKIKRNLFENKGIVAIAKREARRGFFKLKLDVFPNIEYFIVKDDVSDHEYGIYSGVEHTNGECDFSKKIGSGVIKVTKKREELLHIKIMLLNIDLFMECRPIDETKEEAIEKERVLKFETRKCA